MKSNTAYGSWQSPISARQVASAAPSIDNLCIDGDDLYWLEARPEERGRNAIVRHDATGQKTDVLPAPFSARSRVHEYGGAPYIVIAGVLYFCEQNDQRIYRIDTGVKGASPEAISPANHNLRFADFCYDTQHQRLICVAEQSSDELDEPRNFIAALSTNSPYEFSELHSGADFYAYPRLSPDGTQLSWISWQHPQMPWQGSELWLANFNDGGLLASPENIAGGRDEAIFQPQWSPAGELYFVSDRNEWWNIYRHENTEKSVAICPQKAEFATPLWTLGMSTYGFCRDGNLAACYTTEGLWRLGLIDEKTKQLTTIDLPFTQISALVSKENCVWFIGASPSQSGCLVELDTQSAQYKIIHQFTALPIAAENYAQPQAITFTTSGSSTNDNEQAHGFYYPPCNAAYSQNTDEKPPLLVLCHGGPTGATSTGFNLKIQFWTNRGFAVLDVNYRGSTGYGRPYRQALDGAWGIKDVDDVVAGAQHLIAQNLVDPERIMIRGGSAGGYTVLAALAFHDLFKAGASYYGIGDLETLARDTHKFESRYLDTLVGPYPAEQALYKQRSPINHIDKLNCPVIFFQGLDDKVVPPQQAEAMVESLEKKGLKVKYIPFSDEGHGFRQAGNTEKAMLEELKFYSEVFGFDLPAVSPSTSA
ncbi:peptidase [Gammaproteobacteria bacterium 50_400_T64]|nr:peptidase [Gammaproteobacteria bacterium 50_400_T64]